MNFAARVHGRLVKSGLMRDIAAMVRLSFFDVDAQEILHPSVEIRRVKFECHEEQTVSILEVPFLASLLSWTRHTCSVCAATFLAWSTDSPRTIAERWHCACAVGTGNHDWMWSIPFFPLKLSLKPDFARLDSFKLCNHCLEDWLRTQVDTDVITIRREDGKPRLEYVLDVPDPCGGREDDHRVVPHLDNEDVRLYTMRETFEK